jgi:hypothetical protein
MRKKIDPVLASSLYGSSAGEPVGAHRAIRQHFSRYPATKWGFLLKMEDPEGNEWVIPISSVEQVGDTVVVKYDQPQRGVC